MKTIVKSGLIPSAIASFIQNKNNTNHKAIKTYLEHNRVNNYNKSSYINPRRNNELSNNELYDKFLVDKILRLT